MRSALVAGLPIATEGPQAWGTMHRGDLDWAAYPRAYSQMRAAWLAARQAAQAGTDGDADLVAIYQDHVSAGRATWDGEVFQVWTGAQDGTAGHWINEGDSD